MTSRRLPPSVACWSLFAIAIGCAPRAISLPGGPGTPIADASRALAPVVTGCSDIRTLVAELAISGRAGPRRLRGRVHAGFERPGSMRLEGVAPFGAPAFVLVAGSATATLWLPREDRVLRDAPPDRIVEALAGVALGADDLRAVLSGCVTPDPTAVSARQLSGGWTAIDLEGGATAFVRAVEYADFSGARPRRVRVAATDRAGPPTDLTVTLSQVEINTPLDPAVFAVSVPEDAEPMTLDELRGAGPLGAR